MNPVPPEIGIVSTAANEAFYTENLSQKLLGAGYI